MISSTFATTSTEQIKEIAKECVDGNSMAPFGVYAFGPNDEGAILARYVEGEVFLDSFGNTSEQLYEEYAPYEARSVFLVVVDHRRLVPAGSMRVIIPERHRASSKSLDDIERYWGLDNRGLTCRDSVRVPVDGCWDIATLAVSADYRGRATTGLVALGLYNAFVGPALQLGIDWVVAILDNNLYRFTNWQFKRPFYILNAQDPKPYLGSQNSFPVSCQLSDWGLNLQRAAPVLYEHIFLGQGFMPAMAPLPVSSFGSIVSEIEQLDATRSDVIDLRDRVSIKPEVGFRQLADASEAVMSPAELANNRP